MNIEQLVTECFTKDFEPKACGREKCMNLIDMMNSLYKPMTFGNSDTGFMNIWAMKMKLLANVSA